MSNGAKTQPWQNTIHIFILPWEDSLHIYQGVTDKSFQNIMSFIPCVIFNFAKSADSVEMHSVSLIQI